MTESAATLLEDMADRLARSRREQRVSVVVEYAQRIAAVGDVALLTEVMRTVENRHLMQLMFYLHRLLGDSGRWWFLRLAFCWQGLPFDGWREILHEISEHDSALYAFVWFARGALALDVAAAFDSDPRMTSSARRLFDAKFRADAGRPNPGDPWWDEYLAERGIDRGAMLSRLAAEGAPVSTSAGRDR